MQVVLVQIAWASVYIIQIGTGEGALGHASLLSYYLDNAHNSHVVRNGHCKLQLQLISLTSNKQCLKLEG